MKFDHSKMAAIVGTQFESYCELLSPLFIQEQRQLLSSLFVQEQRQLILKMNCIIFQQRISYISYTHTHTNDQM